MDKRASSCPYCGNNPVPHFLNWYFESLNVALTPLRTHIVASRPVRAAVSWVGKIISASAAVGVLSRVGIITFRERLEDCTVARARVLWEEAKRRGIAMRELLLLRKPFDCYRAEKNGRALFFSGLPRPRGYDNAGLETMDDKFLLKQKLQGHGLPVPEGGSAATYRQAVKIFRRIQKPVIVKPRAGSRGRHSTTFVQTEADLKKAFRIAKQLCFWVIVEEQLFGPVYRATVIDYRVRGVLRGDSPQVTGNGIRTIAELVAARNLAPHLGTKDISLDGNAELFLARQQKNFTTVPKTGETISLSEKIGVNYGGSSSEDLSICHPDNCAMFERAARAAGDPIVGFDIIMEDITTPYTRQRCGFLEANSLPFINLHHDPLKGNPENVAAVVWDLVGMD